MSRPSPKKMAKKHQRRKQIQKIKNQMRNRNLVMIPGSKIKALKKMGIDPMTVGQPMKLPQPEQIAQQLATMPNKKKQ